LKENLDPASLTIDTIEKRLARLRKDPWAEYWTTRQTLTPFDGARNQPPTLRPTKNGPRRSR
jgi:DNA primase